MLRAAVFILGRVLMAAGSPAPPRISFVLCFLLLGAACSGLGRLFSRVFLVCVAAHGGARGARRRVALLPRPYSPCCVRAFPPSVSGFSLLASVCPAFVGRAVNVRRVPPPVFRFSFPRRLRRLRCAFLRAAASRRLSARARFLLARGADKRAAFLRAALSRLRRMFHAAC